MNTELFDLGKIGITLGGEYDNKVVYEKLTIVLYKGKSYISTKTTQGVSPEQDSKIWQLVAEAKDAYRMLVDAGKITLTEEEFLEQLVDAAKGRYIVQGNVINAADEEDLTVEHSFLLGIDTLKLADRPSTDGMGYVILRKNKTFVEQVTKENTIYEIRYDFTLEDNITIPANCILKFCGGSISGAYTITGTNTCINANLIKIFSTDIIITGTWNITEIYPEWFGAKGDGITDDTAAFEAALRAVEKNISMNGNIQTLYISNGTYLISKTLHIRNFVNIRGENMHQSTLKCNSKLYKFIDCDSTLISITDIRIDSNNNADIGLYVERSNNNMIVLSRFINLRLEGAIECNGWFNHIERCTLTNIIVKFGNIGINIINAMTCIFTFIQIEDANNVNIHIKNSSGFVFEKLYTFNEVKAGQTLCRIEDCYNCVFEHPHFEPQLDCTYNLEILSNKETSGITFNYANFIGRYLQYSGDLIYLHKNNENAVLSNIYFDRSEFIVPKKGSYIIKNEGCDGLILHDCVQKDSYSARYISSIKENNISNFAMYNIKQIVDWGGDETMLPTNRATLYGEGNPVVFNIQKTLPVGIYYLSADVFLNNTEVFIGDNFVSKTKVGFTGSELVTSIKIEITESLSSKPLLLIQKGTVSETAFKYANFVLMPYKTIVNGKEKPIDL